MSNIQHVIDALAEAEAKVVTVHEELSTAVKGLSASALDLEGVDAPVVKRIEEAVTETVSGLNAAVDGAVASILGALSAERQRVEAVLESMSAG